MKMKDKHAKDKKKRDAHRKRLQAAKRRKRQITPELIRETPTKEEKQRILIVCEGENTEPSYFNKFRVTSAVIKSVGEGYNTLSLVKRAIKLSEEQEYDQIWCVFDKDDFSIESFNQAVILGQSKNFKIAYSNQAFEYWLILHFEDHQGGAMHRNQYKNKLNAYLHAFGLKYDGNSKIITDEIFDVLMSLDEKGKARISLAWERAERIYKQCDENNLAKAESSTAVFKLVEEIQKYQ